LASPTKGDAHRYTRDKGRHTSVSFPIWFVELLTLAPPFCSPTTTRRRRENNFFFLLPKSKGNHWRNYYWDHRPPCRCTKRDSVVELF
jgi:hypothetical protein